MQLSGLMLGHVLKLDIVRVLVLFAFPLQSGSSRPAHHHAFGAAGAFGSKALHLGRTCTPWGAQRSEHDLRGLILS